MASSTWASYERGLIQFRQFRTETRLQPSWPAPGEHVAAFIAYLSIKGMAPSTISTYISAVAFCHKLNGWSDPSQNFIVQKLKEGCCRVNRKSDIRRPITLDLLGRLCHIVGCIVKSEHEAVLFHSAFLLAFFGFFWVGEITASSKSADCSRILRLSDVRSEGHDQSTMTLFF